MTAKEVKATVEGKDHRIYQQKVQISSLSRQLMKEKATKKMPVLDVLEMASKENDIYNMAYEIVKAHESKALDKLPKLAVESAKQMFHNCLAKGKQGYRHTSNTHQFFEVLLIWGKARVAKWVCDNLYDMNIDTIRADVRKIPVYNFGILETSFMAAAAVYKKLMAEKSIPCGSVLCEHSEDETAVVTDVAYEPKSKRHDKNELYGF